MARFLTDITSMYWWISVVVVGILINIFGTLISRKMDVPLSKVSTWWRDRSQQRKLEAEQQIAMLASSQHEQIIMATQIISHQIQQSLNALTGIGLLLVGGFAFGFGVGRGSKFILTIGGLTTLLGVSSVFTALRHQLSANTKIRWMNSARDSETSHETHESAK